MDVVHELGCSGTGAQACRCEISPLAAMFQTAIARVVGGAVQLHLRLGRWLFGVDQKPGWIFLRRTGSDRDWLVSRGISLLRTAGSCQVGFHISQSHQVDRGQAGGGDDCVELDPSVMSQSDIAGLGHAGIESQPAVSGIR